MVASVSQRFSLHIASRFYPVLLHVYIAFLAILLLSGPLLLLFRINIQSLPVLWFALILKFKVICLCLLKMEIVVHRVIPHDCCFLSNC